MRVIIVDDEPLARARLRDVLAATPNVEVVAECRDAEEAQQAIADCAPDAMFLDIEMPGTSGLDLARKVENDGQLLVVLVTAHRRYAVEAFDVAAVDYVLKPAEERRCRRAVTRQERVMGVRSDPGAPARSPAPAYINHLFVRGRAGLVRLPAHDIDFVEALGNYVKLHAGERTFVLRGKLSALEARLDPKRFVRTHRSYIVNVERVREILPLPHNDGRILLDTEVEIPLSRGYRGRLQMFVLSEHEPRRVTPA